MFFIVELTLDYYNGVVMFKSTVFFRFLLTFLFIGVIPSKLAGKSFSQAEIVERLCKNPASFTCEVGMLQDQMSAEIEARQLETLALTKGLPLFQSIIEHYEQICPIVLLGECKLNGFALCFLSREHHPKYRKAYEKRVVSSLISTIDAKKGSPVHYVTFGCGTLLQDVIILTQTLKARPYAKIVIHFINIDHRSYLYCYGQNHISHKVNIQESLDPIALKLRVWSALKSDRSPDITEDEVDACLINGYQTDRLMKECLIFLTNAFRQAQLTVYAHATAESYISYIETYKLAAPDYITAADITDEYSMINRSSQDYMWLCAKALTLNKDLHNTLLIQDKYVALWQFALSKPAICAEEFKFEYRDISTNMYLIRKKI